MTVLPHPVGVSVLICTYNGALRLMPTLEHLAQQVTAFDVPWEVILVDNNSSDDTLAQSLMQWEKCGSPVSLRLLSQPKPGKQFALEMAYNAAQYEFMCIVDDDNWLHTGYLQRGFETMKANSDVGLLGGKNVGAFAVELPSWFTTFQASYAVGVPPIYSPVSKHELVTGEVTDGALWGAGLFVRHTIWLKLKILGFKSLFTGRQGEKQLTAGEDDELCYLTRLLGYKIWYDEKLSCTHYMTAGRLEVDYLKRLCYASARAYPAMSAYQKVLTPNWSKYNSIIPWLKDWVYLMFWSMKGIASSKYLKSYFSSRSLKQVRVNQQVLTWYYFTVHFSTTRRYYRDIVALRDRAQKEFINSENNYSLTANR